MVPSGRPSIKGATCSGAEGSRCLGISTQKQAIWEVRPADFYGESTMCQANRKKPIPCPPELPL